MRLPVDPEIITRTLHERAYSRKVRDNPENAPGWRYLGSYYSCIPDPEIPWREALVERCQSRDPGFIPMTVYSLYRSSADYSHQVQVVVKRHAVGRRVLRPKVPKPPFYVRMPRDADFPRPNQIDDIFHEGPRDPAGPYVRGGFCPLDWSLYWYPLVSLTPAQLLRLHVEDPDAELEQQMASAAEEQFYLRRELDRRWEKIRENLSDPEIDEFLKRQAAGAPLFDKPDKPLFVDLGSRPDRRRGH